MLEKINLPFFSFFDVCFDFGTSNTAIGIVSKGQVLNEPTYVGYNSQTGDYIFFGKEALATVGKTPHFIKIIRPIVSAVISDFDAQLALTSHLLDKSVNIYLRSTFPFKPQTRGIAAVPHIATEIEKRAVEEVLYKTGFSSVFLIEKPIAAAFGVGLNIFFHHPHLIVDMGGGLVEMSIVSSGGIVAEKTLKNAGDSMNQALAHYVYLKYGIILGEATCEYLKINLLSFENNTKIINVRGKSLENGLPKSVKIRSSDIREALLNNFIQIIDAIKELFEISPPEIVDEIYERGIILIGGLSKIPHIDKFFSEELKIETTSYLDNNNVIVKGLIKIVENPKVLRHLAIPKI